MFDLVLLPDFPAFECIVTNFLVFLGVIAGDTPFLGAGKGVL